MSKFYIANVAALLPFIFLSLSSIAQTREVTGLVTDAKSKEPIAFANVIVKGTSRGAQTDFDGRYRLELEPTDSVLVFAYVGYNPQTVTIGNRTEINIQLQATASITEEVQVIGYGTVKKSDRTGAVSSLRGADITKIPSLSPEQAMQGKIAGVQVNSASGAPGSTPVVRIRGVGTLNNSAPIYVVDGVILDDISFLSSADIESMEVLKDASATAIYGSRGANGVVIVTTKRAGSGVGTGGGLGEPQISVSAEYSMQHLQKYIDLLSANQFVNVANTISPGTFTSATPIYNTDWQREIFSNQFAPIYNVNVGVTGASARNNYYFGLSYYQQDGIIAKSNYKRLSLKLNDSYQLMKNIRVGINYTVSPDVKQNEAGVIAQAYRAWPTSRPYNDDGSFAEVRGAGNPLAAIEYNNSFTHRVRAVGNVYTDITILKDFVFRSSFGQDYSFVKDRSFTPAFFVSSNQSNVLNDLSVGNTTHFTWLWENTLNYSKQVNKHYFDALVGYTSQRYKREFLQSTIQDLLGEDPALWYISAGNIEYLTSTHNGEINTMTSILGRANYVYDNRYLLTASFRRDGSSKFSKNNRYGNFPSFAVGWNIHNEPFYAKDNKLNRLKLRASWGVIGNEKISWEKQYSLISNNQNAVFNEVLVQGATFGATGNPDLKWEETQQFDAGIELGFWNDKVQLEVDYYNKVTDGILVDLLTPGHLGNGANVTVTYNAAKVLNRGIEANIAYNGKIKQNTNYTIYANGSTIYNEVLSLGSNDDSKAFITSGSLGNGQNVTRTVVGQSVGAYYGYETMGVFQNEAELANSAIIAGQQVGDLKFKDQNGDGIIDANDRTYLGSYIPKFVYGFGTTFTYKNFDWALDFNGQFGNMIYNGKNAVRPDLYNFESRVRDAWTGQGTSNEEPRPTAGGSNYEPSDYFLEKGDYLRLRSFTFGYSFKGKVLGKLNMHNARVYVRGTNLFTLAGYSGYTPEIAGSGVLSSGIDLGVYPITAIYSVGIHLNF
jgi:TonB-linked SusC/RagA family outer membrane protein